MGEEFGEWLWICGIALIEWLVISNVWYYDIQDSRNLANVLSSIWKRIVNILALIVGAKKD